MQKTHISLALHRVFNEAGHQLATGVLIDKANSRLFPINAWVKLSHDGPKKGRKKNFNRIAAVLLAHQWHRACLGMTAGQADSALVSLLRYSEERAVTRVRTGKKKEIDGKFILLTYSGDRKTGAVILLESSAAIDVESNELRFRGPGWVWNYGIQEATYQSQWEGNGCFDPPLNERQLGEMRRWANGGGDINCK